jgi:hypothetical protein
MKPTVIVLCLLVVASTSAYQSKQTLPGKMVFDDPAHNFTVNAGDKGVAPFDHAPHAAKDTCVTCHHTNSEKLTSALEQPVMRCAVCHKAKEETCSVEGSREGKTFKGRMAAKSEDAFHGKDSIVGCIGCHKERDQIPKACATCHVK